MKHRLLAAAAAITLAVGVAAAAPARPAVSLVLDTSAGTPAKIAMEKVRTALVEKHVAVEAAARWDRAHGQTVLVAGVAKGSPAFVEIAKQAGLELPAEADSLAIHRGSYRGRDVVVVAGGDDLGLAYALYDVADRIGWTAAGSNPLAAVRDTSEKPAVRDRSVSTYAMQQAYFESRLFNEDYWGKYFDNLVRNRFNNFTLIFGYESSGYLAPCYAWFFNLPQFPEVRADGVTPEQQQRYLQALNRVIALAHERGLHFTLGIWDHIYDGVSSYYTEGVWDHLPEVNGRKPRWPVEGLNEHNLVAYTQTALRRFLELVPNLDGIQFRMHGESGLSKAGMRNFWEPVFRIIGQEHPQIRFDARAKNFPDDLIQLALHLGVHLRLTTKWEAEQVGMPFEPTHLPRSEQFQTRAGYADLLRYPKQYGFQWRLWTSGTMRLLLWGSPDYARRFAESTHLYDADGFEIAEPLATKMASHPHDEAPIPILNAPDRYYDYEFQRYWPFFQAFGRMAYNPLTLPQVWDQAFQQHFGGQAGPHVERALEEASWILPRIVGYCLPPSDFPTTRGWPERQRWNDLPVYAAAPPSDVQLFASFQEEAHNLLAGADTVKVRPEETSRWFDRTAAAVSQEVADAERLAGPNPGKEFHSTVTDLRILSQLARYHARRIHAGLAYALFEQSGDVSSLDQAIAWEKQATEAWRGLVEAAGAVYSDNLALGLPENRNREKIKLDLSGHWRDELPHLQQGIAALEQQRAQFHPEARQLVGKYVFGKGALPEGFARLPHAPDCAIEVPNGFYELRVTVEGDRPQGYGPMWIEANGVDRTDIFQVKQGETVERTLYSQVRDGRLNVYFANDSTGQWGVHSLVLNRVDPRIVLVPVRVVWRGEDAELRATVYGLDEIRSVRVYLGDAVHGYTPRDMAPGGPLVYGLKIPASELAGQGASDPGYFLEATDAKGRVATFPAAGAAHPIRLAVRSDFFPPTFQYSPVLTARAGQSLRIAAYVSDPSGLKWVRLRYRSVTQYQDYATVRMEPTGRLNEYAAEIPGNQIVSTWDLMYFFEIMNNQGDGRIYPDELQATPYIVTRVEAGK